MNIDGLDFKNIFVCAQGVEIAVLWRLAHHLYDEGVRQASARVTKWP